jgi:glycosyltransferase involved in cell wall biosynthesis
LQVAPDRPEQLARALSTVLNSPGLSRHLATNGRETAIGTYDWRVIGLRLERLYAEVARH